MNHNLDKILVTNEFIDNCKDCRNELYLFKVIPVADDIALENITQEYYEYNIRDAGNGSFYERLYFPVKIDDDVISVKMYDPKHDFDSFNHLYFVYNLKHIKPLDNEDEDYEEREKLAFVINSTAEPGSESLNLDSDLENYVQFDLRMIDGLSCKFLTFTSNRINLDPEHQETNFKFYNGSDHNHMTELNWEEFQNDPSKDSTMNLLDPYKFNKDITLDTFSSIQYCNSFPYAATPKADSDRIFVDVAGRINYYFQNEWRESGFSGTEIYTSSGPSKALADASFNIEREDYLIDTVEHWRYPAFLENDNQ